MRNDPERTLIDLIAAAIPLDGSMAPAPVVPAELWPQIAEAARRHGLAPLLYESLKKRGTIAQPPERILEMLRALYLQASARNWWAYHELDQWLNCFAREQIPVVLLKGCALAATLYEGIALRPVGDLDLLIPRAMAARARALLLQQGYTPFEGERRDDCALRFASQQSFWRDAPQPSLIDMHWHPFGSPYYFERIPVEWFWQRTATLQLNGRTARVLTPEAQLLHLSAHYVLQHLSVGLKWSYDLALLLSRCAAQLDWQAFIQAVNAFGLTQVAQSAFAHVSECWGVSPPADVSARLTATRPALGARMAFALTTARRSAALIVWQGLTTPGVKAKLQFWRCYAFPSAGYMRARYHSGRARLLPLFYVWRIVAGLYQVVRSTLALLRKT